MAKTPECAIVNKGWYESGWTRLEMKLTYSASLIYVQFVYTYFAVYGVRYYTRRNASKMKMWGKVINYGILVYICITQIFHMDACDEMCMKSFEWALRPGHGA